MRFKLDENLDPRLASLLSEGGHDVETVLSEGMSGKSDETIYAMCQEERRTLLTLDLDFSNPLRFPPGSTEGIVVIRPPLPLLPLIRATLRGALAQIKSGHVRGQLWIVEPGRIRVHDPADSGEHSS
jgi:predicted nuclease of predicted toxin-antitoxin system